MAKATRKLTTALAVSATLLTARAATAAGASDRAAIVLHVDDFSGLLPQDVDAAVTMARRVFMEAGIHTVWVFGGNRKPPIIGALHLKVIVLSKEMAEQKIASDGVQGNVLGQAAKDCGRAYIYSHRIAELAARNQRRVGELLGWVIAHEVGHLALPGNGHSPSGIMRSALDLRAAALPAFTLDQIAALRQRVASAN
jgi:hypothetical protein